MHLHFLFPIGGKRTKRQTYPKTKKPTHKSTGVHSRAYKWNFENGKLFRHRSKPEKRKKNKGYIARGKTKGKNESEQWKCDKAHAAPERVCVPRQQRARLTMVSRDQEKLAAGKNNPTEEKNEGPEAQSKLSGRCGRRRQCHFRSSRYNRRQSLPGAKRIGEDDEQY